MSTIEWAKNEVKIACKHEAPNRKDGEWDYGCACYESALKAFKSLCEDGHSGMSIGFTKRILNRLIDCKPLTPIEDAEDTWDCVCNSDKDNTKVYQCKRMSSLFKRVLPDGTIRYSDNDRIVCYDINNQSVGYRNGFIFSIVNEKYPLTMPYYPASRPIRVYTEDFLAYEGNGDFDTIGILKIELPDGKGNECRMFFKEYGTKIIEISEKEYYKRKALAKELRKKKQGDASNE